MFTRCLAVLAPSLLFASLWLEPAQKPSVLPPTVHAIRDARVVVEPGKVLPRATVVIRDGLIEAVGAEVKVPADALVIEGKGLTVYAGFIDAGSAWGFDAQAQKSEGGPPAVEDLASQALAATKPDNRKGITPEFQVRTALKADEQVEAWRKAGITARLVQPESGFLSGQSALVSLNGGTPRESVLLPAPFLHLQFRTIAAGDYPRSLMGVFAHLRQTFLDAEHYRQAWQRYEDAGRSGKRPPHDPALAALGPALAGKQPIVLEANSRDEIDRALNFAGEFRLRPLIRGGRDAWKAADRLVRDKVPVFLSLDFTEPREEREKPPAKVIQDRQRKLREEKACAGVLARRGIPFAFSASGITADRFLPRVRETIEAGLPADAALAALTVNPAKILGLERSLGTVAAGKSAHLVVMDGDFHQAKSQVRYLFADGVRFSFEPEKKAEASKEEKKDAEKKPEKDEQPSEIDADRVPGIKTGGNVLIRGATLLTISQGVKQEQDLLVLKGKIARIGKDLKAPEGVTVIEARGMFVMPGIIDTHSHFGISGGVNEFSLSIVPEVRVRDVVNSEDVAIYRGLAGGVTTARLLHGSANVIGGQDAVIKLKYGKPASELLLADAPRGVKFALGENVKRTDGRFPNTRLGVEALLIRAFSEAREYRQAWEKYRKTPSGLPPRRDLRLEALADVLAGDLRVHCHCYRADEILMLLRVADRFGFKVRSLQHVLEGYKVAPEIAAHGASNSSFADWWAYKLEAYDAIPFNPALLHEAGAEVCLKSDSNELMRHLYQDAAKCIKYGGLSETEALRTITLNPARQLGLDRRLGSLEAGKDADLAIFNGHPLNSLARVEMTLIEGEVYFQRSSKLTPASFAQTPPAKPVNRMIPAVRHTKKGVVIHDVTVHPVSGPAIPGATVTLVEGKIISIVKNGPRPPAEERPVIDGKGLHLYPGLIDAGTVLGLTELGSARETQDYAESGDFQPDLRAATGINPDSELIPVTRANGVTTVVTRPTGTIIAGQSALINLAGWVPREMTLIDPLALHVDFPPAALPGFLLTDPNGPRLGRAVERKQRAEKLRRLRELFAQAVAYHKARTEKPSETPANPRLQALAPYALGQKPVIIQVQRKAEILEAIQLADELKIRVILSGAIDAWKVAGELKKRDIPVILGPVMSLPAEQYDPYDAPYACAARLHQAGVRFCIRSAGASNTRNLPYEAAMAASYGLPVEEAIKAVTLYPAKILGVEKELGSIEVGKRANLVLTNGDILQASTQVVGVFIDGRPLQPTSKHTRLYERYRERLREVRDSR